MKEVYLKSGLFGVAGSDLVVFDYDEDRNTEFVKDGYRYEWVDNFDLGDVFYTIHQDDEDGTFVEDPLKGYYSKFGVAKRMCCGYFDEQDPTTIMGMYVMKWVVGEEYLYGECVFEMKVEE